MIVASTRKPAANPVFMIKTSGLIAHWPIRTPNAHWRGIRLRPLFIVRGKTDHFLSNFNAEHIDYRRDLPLSSLLDGFQCTRHDEHVSYGSSAAAVPPFGCTFSSAPGHQNNVAVANEEGFVTIFNTGEYKSSVLKEWQAHDNAVFDISWVPGANSLVTASGDQTARLWDVITGDLLGTFKGHQCSLKSDSQQGVTVVLFCDDNRLISSGAVDGTIKMWDLRKNYTAYHHNPHPLQTYPYPGSCTRKLGYSGLSLDSTGSRLFSNCTDDNIYMFNISGLKTTPVAVFRGHSNSSFYVKSSVSPDDQFLASGSSDHHAYIWKITDPKQPPVMLQGHSQEVTSVAWCPTDFTKVLSALLLSLQPKALCWSLRDLRLCLRPSLLLVPPLVLICPSHQTHLHLWPNSEAPNWPHPSSSGSAAALPQPPGDASPCRKVLKPVLQASCSERRAKRRLETGDASVVGEETDGVSELCPDAKRSRSSEISHSSSKENKHAVFRLQREGSLSSAVQAGKENSSPKKTDWLSVMSQKLKGSAQPKSSSLFTSHKGPLPFTSPKSIALQTYEKNLQLLHKKNPRLIVRRSEVSARDCSVV
ncbi:Denticleless protein -like protein [Triplophysa tibetana]|uniref:Denticleless protein-like protein n=1 Tax=Triplophysa tibetana TaxID=1572043 RepID=A0A5A9NHV4_9TELE|nr:Denticleless protein -like protein [Triplophysa tibetana]